MPQSELMQVTQVPQVLLYSEEVIANATLIQEQGSEVLKLEYRKIPMTLIEQQLKGNPDRWSFCYLY
jgi:hypothetical protein